MTADLSAELALALGYFPESVQFDLETTHTKREGIRTMPGERIAYVFGQWENALVGYWRRFDYRHPSVYGPLVAWLGEKHDREPWYSSSRRKWMTATAQYDTLPEAVARACIALKGKP